MKNGTSVAMLVLKYPRPEALLLGFAAFNARALRNGVDRLAAALETARSRSY